MLIIGFLGELINLDNVVTLDRDGRTLQRPRRRFSLREGNRSQRMYVIYIYFDLSILCFIRKLWFYYCKSIL